jgi:tetratricopeptide (TPR) repeat protein
LKTAKHDTSKATILNQLSNAYMSNNPDKAMDYARQSLDLSEQIGYKKGAGKAYMIMGDMYTKKGVNTQALEFYRNAFKRMEETGDNKSIAGIYNSIGFALRDLCNYQEALENYNASLKIYEKLFNFTLFGSLCCFIRAG